MFRNKKKIWDFSTAVSAIFPGKQSTSCIYFKLLKRDHAVGSSREVSGLVTYNVMTV